MKKNSGIVSLTVVIFMMVIMVLILALLQSRILLAIQRTKGAADTILSTYNAESEIYDTLARFRQGLPLNAKPEETLADGTKLTTEMVTVGNEQQINITAKLPFATTKLQMSRLITSTTSLNGVDLILSLDCTGSMKECADPEVTKEHGTNQYCNQGGVKETTKFEELRKGTVAFLNGLKDIPGIPVRVGVSVFSGDSDWAVLHNTTSQIKPGSASIDDIIQTINSDFNTKNPQNSAGCKVIPEEGTSHASGLLFMHNYFAINTPPDTKQVEVLVTDGEPTTSIPAPQCGTDFQYLIPAGNSERCKKFLPFTPILNPFTTWSCKPNGADYARGGQEGTATRLAACMVTNSNRVWEGSQIGQRNPNIDAYIIATFKQADDQPFKKVMTTEPGVYYYDTENAENLTAILKEDVIKDITKTINEFRIRRVIP